MITVLTPSYNRAYILNKAFESLCAQTVFDFEWIIVDDGSTDDTEKLVLSWKEKDLPFELSYYKQNNGGKHRALNYGIKLAKYDYVLILDSDDYLTQNAVEKIHEWLKTIEGKTEFAGVAGLRGWIGKPGCIGECDRGEKFIDAKNTERRKYRLSGDKAEAYKTELLRRYPFPEFEGEKFLSEHVVWDTIANAGYKLRWFNEVIYKCEYLQDGLTKNSSFKLYLDSFQGFTLSTKIRWQVESFPWNYFSIGLYAHVAKLKGIKTKQVKKTLGVNGFQLFIGDIIFRANELKKKIKNKKR